MFEQLTSRLTPVFKKLRSRGKLHPKQVDNALAEIRIALLEADAAAEVADAMLGRVRERALSEEVMRSITPGQQVVKIVNDELAETLGGKHRPFELPNASPAVVMMAGLQGSGKTTACAKLALHLREKGKRPLLAAADLLRPAAVEQLRTLGEEIGVPVVSEGRDPVRVAKAALKEASRRGHDVLIVDTGGRLHIDEEMMREARRIRDVLRPHHVLMAADAMTGQDALRQARAFMREVDLTGFVLTKLDGDARGGAALSVTAATGRPIFFAGVGERAKDLEVFHPDRMASRILGMGDVVSLVEKAQREMDEERAREQAERIMQARFTLEDFLEQLRQVRKLGPLKDLMGMLPGAGELAAVDIDEREVARTEAIISSMTPEERQSPEIINGSRRARIAGGSGTSVAQVNALLKQFDQARTMMQRLTGGGLKGLRGLPGLPGLPGMPPR
ncbi:MAG TPA: signal recognition particle protein [Actinomycetota bacterium]|nr:signal recognition particle protein [Actinomycetota bacterium]